MSNYIFDIDVLETFELLAQTGSSLAKRDIIVSNREDENFCRFLNYLLNPFLITGISEKKISKQTDKEATQSFDVFSELMEYVLVNNTGSDEVIANISAFLDGVQDDLRVFYSSIITKSLKLGCDIKSVNKAFGYEFLPQWEVQQSYNIEKSPLKEGEWFSLSEKLNGVRGTFFEGKIFSRQGKEFTGLAHIVSDINSLFDDADGFVLDGELVRKNVEGIADNENFRIGTGLLGQDDADKSSIQFVIFDLLAKDDFKQGQSSEKYKERLSKLTGLRDKINEQNLTSLTTVKVLYTGDDQSKVEHFLDIMVKEDKEGLMLNRDSEYKCKRHNGILKVKRFYTVDLRVVALEEGSGRLSGILGAFVVDYKGNSLNVGSGMTDEQRALFWSKRDELIDRVIEVKYKEESSDKKTGQFSLQFPIFVTLREEGKQESYF